MAEGIRLELSITDLGIAPALDRAIAHGENLTPVLELSGSVLQQSVRDRFDSGRGPNGIPWPQTGRTKAAALPKKGARGKNKFGPRHGGKPLVDKGNMLGDLGQEVEGKTLRVGIQALHTSSRYAYVHQFGATIHAKGDGFMVFTGADGGLVFAKEVTIPARPFLGFDNANVADLEDLWANYAREPFDGR
jgi:phage gpG-like protein